MGLLSYELKKRCFPIERGSGDSYINLTVALNGKGTGTLQVLKPLENEIIAATGERLAKWRKKDFSKSEARRLYKWIDKRVVETYEKRFGLDIEVLKQNEIEKKTLKNNY